MVAHRVLLCRTHLFAFNSTTTRRICVRSHVIIVGMTFRVARILTHLGILFACSSALAAGAPPVQQSLADEFEDSFRQQVAADKILGAAYAVVSRERVIRMGVAGFTDTRRKQRINTDTVFRLASVSKTFAAELAAQMVQEGSLSLMIRSPSTSRRLYHG
jgi:CubicO group peptidase (beta-lactamase class C family)